MNTEQAARPPQDVRIRALRRKKNIAVALLALAGTVLVVSFTLGRLFPHWGFELAAAMAEAALVGGLADWFAVVALFRHPLGQRWIPHTAIIPAKKDSIGRSLADFICNHFLAKDQVLARLESVDVASRLARKLADDASAQLIGDKLTAAVPHLLGLLDSEPLHRFIHDAARSRLQRVDLSGVAAFGLRQLTLDGRHEALVDEALGYVRDALQSPETHRNISERAAKEVWGILRYARLDEMIANRIADKLVAGLTSLVTEMSMDRDHEMRQRIAGEIDGLIGRLESDEEFRVRVNEFRDRLLDQAELASYLRSLWDDLLAWLQEDVRKPDSQIRARLAHGTQRLGARLLASEEMRSWINGAVIETLEPMIDPLRGKARSFITERVQRWSAEELTRELELSIGGDLQYIRYNGTAIGALIGGLIFAVMHGIQTLTG
ncbi:DUF445 domain-containing protein [Lysobacter korlensis]|uniref:DUF445 domain-containing protein n=1 Tax=Lysobacter korlensis TaxID=553636 RepID=A0ABV6RRR4_9GAMM